MRLRERPGLRALCVFLCTIIVALALTGCRRQRSHVESVGSDEGADIIFEGEISQGTSVHALSGQLLLTVSMRGYSTDLRMKFSDKEEKVWPNLAVGGRKIVEFESVDYMIDVLEVDGYSARIAIVRKR